MNIETSLVGHQNHLAPATLLPLEHTPAIRYMNKRALCLIWLMLFSHLNAFENVLLATKEYTIRSTSRSHHERRRMSEEQQEYGFPQYVGAVVNDPHVTTHARCKRGKLFIWVLAFFP